MIEALTNDEVSFKVIGIDPGLNNLGLTLLEIDYETFKILHTQAITLQPEKYLRCSVFRPEEITAEDKLKFYEEVLTNIFSFIRPFIVGCESPYYNPKRPAAFKTLLAILNVIRVSIKKENYSKTLYTVDPSTVKKTLGVSGISGDKNLMKNRFIELTKTGDFGIVHNLDSFSEHAIDSWGVAINTLSTFVDIQRIPISRHSK